MEKGAIFLRKIDINAYYYHHSIKTHVECVALIEKKYLEIKGLGQFAPFFHVCFMFP